MPPSTRPRWVVVLAYLLVFTPVAAPGDDTRPSAERAPSPAPAPAAPLPTRSRAERPVYPHKAVRHEEFGTGPRSFWLFEPAQPRPASAPVVVFQHGWMAMNPGAYGAWIEHLVRGGNVVIYPRYQRDVTTPPSKFLPNSLAAVHDAFDVLDAAPGHVRPDRKRFALVGHSAGGNLSALMAAVARDEGLPEPKAVIAITPGEVQPLPGSALERIPVRTLLVVVAAEHDWIVGDQRARQIFAEATAVPEANKQYVLFRTDVHGSPPLVADHAAPTAAHADYDTGEGPFRNLQMALGQTDAIDRFGIWRLTDLTLDAGFTGKTLREATRDGDILRDLGHWSDGRAVAGPFVSSGDLSAIPRVIIPHGLRLLPWPRPRAMKTAAKTP